MLAGEVPWVMRTIKRFEGQAAQKGVKICNFCGFDSIPLCPGHPVRHPLLAEEAWQVRGVTAAAMILMCQPVPWAIQWARGVTGSLPLTAHCIVRGLQQAEHSFQ